MGLTDRDWIQVFLLLGEKYLPLIFPSLSRHGNNLDALFTELIGNVNQETEIAKLRSALSAVSRKANEQVQICLFRIKSLYTMAINQPHFTDDKLQVRADFLAISTIPHLINPATNLAFQQFVQVKSLEGEITCCTEGANFISSQEQMGSEWQIQATMFLPKNCTMLDLQSLEANTVKDLVISQTRLVNQQKTKPFVRSRDSSYSSYSKDDKNKPRREELHKIRLL